MTNRKQLTPIEALYYDMIYLIPTHHRKMCSDLFVYYKQLEKERMLDCYLKGDVFPRKYEFEQWYEKTYGGNK